jgi:hypothetical protein
MATGGLEESNLKVLAADCMKAIGALCAVLLFSLPLSSADRKTLTQAEARKLALAAMPDEVRNPPSVVERDQRRVTIELDRDQSGCAVYHAYRVTPGDETMTFTVGWWSVDLPTGEVWDEVYSKRVTNREIEAIQTAIRRRLRVTPAEASASISRPCYERYSK